MTKELILETAITEYTVGVQRWELRKGLVGEWCGKQWRGQVQ